MAGSAPSSRRARAVLPLLPPHRERDGPPTLAHVLRWPALLAATVAGGWVLNAAGLPSAYLFASLLAGLVTALAFPGELALPAPVFTAAQAVTGVVLGAYLKTSS